VIENQKNLLQVEALAAEAITTAVRGLLPVKKILADYMDGDAEEIEEETHAENVIHHVPAVEVEEEKPAAAVAVAAPLEPVKVEEEPAAGVKFSNYDTVFDDKQPAPELRYTPKEGEVAETVEDLDDLDDELDAMGSDTLSINEESTTTVGDDDFEDLEPKPKPAAAAAPVVNETIGEDEMIPLE
jgi:hypothetical protein